MNPDDPKFTAYALEELEPAERAELEAMLKDDPGALAEIEETRVFAERLRAELRAEPAEPLSDRQRVALLETKTRTAQTAEKGGIPLHSKVHALPWWQRHRIPLAAAAAVLLCVEILSLYGVRYYGLVSVRAGSGISDPRQPSESDQRLLAFGDRLLGRRNATASEDAVYLSQASEGAKSPFNEIQAGDIQASGTAAPESKFLSDTSAPSGALSPAAEIDRGSPVDLDNAALLSTAKEDLVVSSGAASITLQESPAKDKDVRMFSDQSPPLSSAVTAPAPSVSPAGLPASMTARVGGAKHSSRLAMAQLPEEPAASAKMAASTISGAVRSRSMGSWAYRRDGIDNTLEEVHGGRDRFEEKEFKRSRIRPLADDETTESYDGVTDNAFLKVSDAPLSTFSIDVDTASYSNVRRFLNSNTLPPKAAVRIEELVNYFTYDYPQPQGETPFSANMEVAAAPWAPEHRLVRIALKGREIKRDARPPSNLIFLIDVSGSMQPENRLPLVRQSMQLLIDQLTPRDQVGIVVYAGASGVVLEPTRDKAQIREALSRLSAGGSTNGGAGIQLAYDMAQKAFIKGGTNRVILATDGDFNVGVTSQDELVRLVQTKAKSGVFLSVLGYGMDNLKDSILEKLANKGNGNYAYIDTLSEGRRVLVDQIGGTLITIAKDVKIQVEFNPAQVGAYRLIGYENRLLAKEDFNDDTKDAGEIGAGHTVTALYEIVPAGKSIPAGAGVDDLKYQPSGVKEAEVRLRDANAAVEGAEAGRELLTLKLRYKAPDADVSKKSEFPLVDAGAGWERSTGDFRFAAAVASFGMILRDSPHKGQATWASTLELAGEGKGEDPSGYRAEFIGLVEKAKALSR